MIKKQLKHIIKILLVNLVITNFIFPLNLIPLAQAAQVSNTWTPSNHPGSAASGAALAATATDLYMLEGNNSKKFYKLNPSTGVWDSTLQDTPFNMGAGACLDYDISTNKIWALAGGGTNEFFSYNYNSAGNHWFWGNPHAYAPENFGTGATCVRGNITSQNDGFYVYVLQGGTNKFWRYDYKREKWEVMADLPVTAGEGACLAYDENDTIYALAGNNTASFYKYTISTNTWAQLQDFGGTGGTINKLVGASDDVYYSPYATNQVLVGTATDYRGYFRWQLNELPLGADIISANISTTTLYMAWPGGDFNMAAYLLEGNCPSFTSTEPTLAIWGTTVNFNFSLPSDYFGAWTSGDMSVLVQRFIDTRASINDYMGIKLKKPVADNKAIQIWDNTTRLNVSWSPAVARAGASMVYAGGNIYAIPGGGKNRFWKYTQASNTWTQMNASTSTVVKTYYITANAEDGVETMQARGTGPVLVSSSWDGNQGGPGKLKLGYQNLGGLEFDAWDNGFRFTSIDIPKLNPAVIKTNIVTAGLSLYYASYDAGDGNNCSFNVYARKEGNLPVWSYPGNLPSTVPRTTAIGNLTLPALGPFNTYYSVNVKDVVQEVIDLSAWVKNNPIGFFVSRSFSDVTRYLTVYAYEKGTAYRPKLDVSYKLDLYFGAGASLIYDSYAPNNFEPEYIYAVLGGNTPALARYNIAGNFWETKEEQPTILKDVPVNVGAGGSGVRWGPALLVLCGGGSNSLYCLTGAYNWVQKSNPVSVPGTNFGPRMALDYGYNLCTVTLGKDNASDIWVYQGVDGPWDTYKKPSILTGGTQTKTYLINAGVDDTDKDSSNASSGGGTQSLMWGASGDYYTFLRWHLDIPAAATINSAYISVRADEANVNQTSSVTANVELLDTLTPDFSTTPRTIAITGTPVSWAIASMTIRTWYNSPSLVSFLQSHVNKVGYDPNNSGQYIGLRIRKTSASPVYREICEYECADGGTQGANSAKLVVNYTAPPVETVVNISSGGSICDIVGNGLYVAAGGGTNTFLKYNTASNSWSTLTNIPENIGSGGSICSLGSNEIYCLIGNNTDSFYKYNVITDTWGPCIHFPGGLVTSSAGIISDRTSNVFVCAGGSGQGLYKYDGAAWTQLKNTPAAIANSGSKLAYLEDAYGGKLYTLKGTNNDVWYYDIQDNMWTPPDFPSMQYADSSNFSGVTQDDAGNIYVNNKYKLWKFTPSANNWTLLYTASNAYEFGAITYVRNRQNNKEYIYLANLYSGENNIFRYNITDNLFEPMNSSPVGLGLGFQYGSSLIWAGGDYVYQNDSMQANFNRYSVSGNSWSGLANSPTAVSERMVWDGNRYVYGVDWLFSSDKFYRYDLIKNEWKDLGTPSPGGFNASLVCHDGFIYAISGNDTKNFWRYNPNTNSLVEYDPLDLPNNVGGLSINVRGNKLACDADYIYCLPGVYSGNDSTSDFWRYRPPERPHGSSWKEVF